MHQTFYIDIDEEITSIIERLKKTKAKDVVVVVPKHALLIQSIINLKLLKKESEKLRKEIIIVTQDKMGKLLVEKAGLVAEQRIEDFEEETQVFEEKEEKKDVDLSDKFTAKTTELEELGSKNYFEETSNRSRRPIKIEAPEENVAEKILNKELVFKPKLSVQGKFFSKKAAQSLDMIKNIDIRQKGDEEKEQLLEKTENKKKRSKKEKFPDELLEEKESEGFSSKKAEEFFARADRFKKQKDPYQEVQIGGKVWKIFFWFCFSVIILVGLVGFYLYFPKATITLESKSNIKSLDLEIKGENSVSEVNFVDSIIPVEKIEIEGELTQNFQATGKKSDSNKKARGTITIYNEFSSSPQPLVATTRFLSEDGKIFRLDKSIVVPGMANVGGENKIGAIEVEVTADEAGAEYNIGPNRFSIPGFQGSGAGKYEKIYAKSSKAMIGGGDSETEVVAISETDIANAKNELTSKIQESLKQKAKNQAGEEKNILEDAIVFNDPNFSYSVQDGMVGESFEMSVKANAKFIVFRKDHLRRLAEEKVISSTGIQKGQLSEDSINFEFGKSDTNFDETKMIIRVNVKAKILPSLNLEEMKMDILGKNEEDFVAYIRQFKELENAYINFNVPFRNGRIPSFPSRVDLSLDNN